MTKWGQSSMAMQYKYFLYYAELHIILVMSVLDRCIKHSYKSALNFKPVVVLKKLWS